MRINMSMSIKGISCSTCFGAAVKCDVTSIFFAFLMLLRADEEEEEEDEKGEVEGGVSILHAPHTKT